MNIGQAASASGVSAKMLRHYEGIGLVPKAGRTEAGYRTYGEAEVHTLRFIRRARDLGLPIERIRLLVGLWRDKDRSSADVKALAVEHIEHLCEKVAQMEEMIATLRHLAERCSDDDRPDCPILEGLTTSIAPESIRTNGRKRTKPHSRRAPRTATSARSSFA